MPNYTDEQMRNILKNAQTGYFAEETFQKAERDTEPFEFKGKTADALREIIRRTNPGLPQPGYDEKQEVLKEVHALKKQLDDERTAAKQKAEDDEWSAERAAVQKEYKYTDKQMDELFDYMKKRNLGNWHDAALVKQAREPRMSEPADAGGGMYMNYSKTEDWDEIGKNPDKWLEKTVRGVADTLEQQDRLHNYRR